MKSVRLDEAEKAGVSAFKASYPTGEAVLFYREAEIIDDTPQEGVALYANLTRAEMHALACGGRVRLFMPDIQTPPLVRFTIIADQPVSTGYSDDAIDYLARLAYTAGTIGRATKWEEAPDAMRDLYRTKVTAILQALKTMAERRESEQAEAKP